MRNTAIQSKPPNFTAPFSFLRPDHFITYHPTIYRHHCRELLERIATGADTRPGTLAEAAIAIMQVTLATPVQRDVAILYGRLFKRFFPEQYETLRYFPTEESYPGRCDEILATLLRKLTAPRRIAEVYLLNIARELLDYEARHKGAIAMNTKFTIEATQVVRPSVRANAHHPAPLHRDATAVDVL